MHSLWHDVHCLNSSIKDDLNTMNLISSIVEAGCIDGNSSSISSLQLLTKSLLVCMHLYLFCCSVFLDDLKGSIKISVLWVTCYGFSFGITWIILFCLKFLKRWCSQKVALYSYWSQIRLISHGSFKLIYCNMIYTGSKSCILPIWCISALVCFVGGSWTNSGSCNSAVLDCWLGYVVVLADKTSSTNYKKQIISILM